MKGHGHGRKKGRQPSPWTVGDPADQRGIAALVAAYLDWLRVRNYSDATLYGREKSLRVFATWLEARGITRPANVTKPILERYQTWLAHHRKTNGRLLSAASQHSRLVPVRGFFKWLARQNHILSNPAADLELPRLEMRLPKHVLTAEEVERVMEGVDLRVPNGVRDRAILETFYSTGIRRRELIGLHLADLDAARGTLMVRQGKGKRDRLLPIGEPAVQWIRAYIAGTRSKFALAPDEGTLFLTDGGEPFAPSTVTTLVRGPIERAKLGKHGSCHLFRHTMATLMLENGADIRFIQEMLGHATLSTTQIYTNVSIRKLKDVHSATHPSAKSSPERSGPITEGGREAEQRSAREELRTALDAEVTDEEDVE